MPRKRGWLRIRVPSLVAATRTPMSPQDFWPNLDARFALKAGQDPTRGQLLILAAQWCLETANGQSMVQWNVGNVKHVDGDGLDWTSFTTTEYIDGQAHVMTQLFKAYPSCEAGIDAYLGMFLGGRYSNAWPFVLDADPTGFVHALHVRGYFTAPEAGYLAGVEARLAQLEAMNLAEPGGGP